MLKALCGKIQKSCKHKPETRLLEKSCKALFFFLPPDSVNTVKPVYVNLWFYGGMPCSCRTDDGLKGPPIKRPTSKITDLQGAALTFGCTQRSGSESFAEPSPKDSAQRIPWDWAGSQRVLRFKSWVQTRN